MAETQAVQPIQKHRQRSPNYPAISLREAMEKALKLYQADGRAGSLVESAVRHLGFNRPHGTAMTALSALKKYGLVDVANNRVNLTQRAISALVYPDNDSRKIEAIRAAALAPEIYADIYNGYVSAGQLPSEMSLRAELEAELKFNPRAVADFVRDFKTTLNYAGLLDEDGITLRPVGGDGGSTAQPQAVPTPTKYTPKIGDYVQWESRGVLQFLEPQRVRALSDDGQFAFVDGSTTGLPVAELTQQPKPETPLNAPSKNTAMREDIFSLAEGQVRIQWPTPLSPESIQDLKDWLSIVERKITRSTAPTQESNRDESS